MKCTVSQNSFTGFADTTFYKNEIKPDYSVLTIEQSNDGPVFGTIYLKYEESDNTSKAISHGLSINKVLYKRIIKDGKTVIKKIKDNETL